MPYRYRPGAPGHRLCAGLLLTLAVALGGLASAPARADVCERTLTLGVEPYAPFQFHGPRGWRGLDISILSAVLDRMGCSLEVEPIPWKRHLISMMHGGDIDIAASAHRTPDRESFAHFSDPYRPSKTVLLVSGTPDSTPSTLRDFFKAGKVLGVVFGYEYGRTASALIEAYPEQIIMTAYPRTNIRLVQWGRIDGTIGDLFVMAEATRTARAAGKVAIAETVVDRQPVHFMFAKKTVPADFVARFNATLEVFKTSDEWDELFRAYLD